MWRSYCRNLDLREKLEVVDVVSVGPGIFERGNESSPLTLDFL